MADKDLCGDVVKYANRVVTWHKAKDTERMLLDGEELFEILALHFATSVPARAPLRRLIQAQQEHQGKAARYRGLDQDALCAAPRAVIPLMVAYEMDRLGIQLHPQVGWGHWLNEFHRISEMVAQPYDA